jgi:hypothetical protein
MEELQIVGRDDDDELSERASTERLATVKTEFTCGSAGAVRIELYRSTDDEDRGGVVLRLTSDGSDGAFLPHAVEIKGGVELHLAGDAEAGCLLFSLQQLLLAFPKLMKPLGIQDTILSYGEAGRKIQIEG